MDPDPVDGRYHRCRLIGRSDPYLCLVRHDTFLTTLGTRGDRGYSRLWVEDSAGRLSNNGFNSGSGFEAQPRAGLGLILRPSVLASTHVSSRRGSAILSYESKALPHLMRGAGAARVRITVNAIFIMPSLRHFSIGRPQEALWKIEGNVLNRPNCTQRIDGAVPARFDATPARLDAVIAEDNLVFATEVMSNSKPAIVSLSGESRLVAIAGQFLAAIGYALAEDGTYAR